MKSKKLKDNNIEYLKDIPDINDVNISADIPYRLPVIPLKDIERLLQ